MGDWTAEAGAAAALATALAIHLLFRAAEALERVGRVPTRDAVMVPGLVLLFGAIAVGLDALDTVRPAMLRSVGFGAMLGANIGAWVPRPGRRRQRR